jgi:hypothetical protein
MEGHQISEMYEGKGDGEFTLVLHHCNENPIVATNTAGLASLKGTKEQFRNLWEDISENFEFEKGDDE